MREVNTEIKAQDNDEQGEIQEMKEAECQRTISTVFDDEVQFIDKDVTFGKDLKINKGVKDVKVIDCNIGGGGPVNIDIDTMYDFKLSERYYKNKNTNRLL